MDESVSVSNSHLKMMSMRLHGMFAYRICTLPRLLVHDSRSTLLRLEIQERIIFRRSPASSTLKFLCWDWLTRSPVSLHSHYPVRLSFAMAWYFHALHGTRWLRVAVITDRRKKCQFELVDCPLVLNSSFFISLRVIVFSLSSNSSRDLDNLCDIYSSASCFN